MKAGDKYESPSGLGFVITAVTKKTITVSVDRVYRRADKKKVVQQNTRIVPVEQWATFVKPYRPC